jgi:hypothetical protein|tara:strand:+ start:2254 stop:3147 length:894 start_codon:yes stop_codon:yes gene_type:complete
MGLKNLKSNLDIHGGNQAGLIGGNPGGFASNPSSPFDGGAYKATGPDVGVENNDYDNFRDMGNTDDPFVSKQSSNGGIYPSTDDHLVAMLERRKTKSRNEVPLGPPTNYNLPMEYVDANGNSGGSGQGTLNDVPSPNNAQNGNGVFGDALGQGKTVGGEDLHVAMLQNNYTSTNTSANFNGTSYGAGQPTSTYPTIKASPVQRDTPNFQDLNTTTNGIGDAPGFANFRNPYTNPSAEPLQSAGGLDTVSEKGLAGTYTSTINPTNNYNSNWPTPSRQTPDLDINGATPGKYQNNLPQ